MSWKILLKKTNQIDYIVSSSWILNALPTNKRSYWLRANNYVSTRRVEFHDLYNISGKKYYGGNTTSMYKPTRIAKYWAKIREKVKRDGDYHQSPLDREE